ncbi:MAG: hypothetical protein KME15_07055 [Drouetiella hepatica Uher 2000/2452]|uniref:Uncharacterized protein n=1 Tax=Drouetiella hepatica Uher 2000/2452 TaxID=904376 RepID=A0A951ULL4_9CYAN|nr:hypothetical protein [Drouetiella hepatica Uher 2000/2452]
MAILDSMATAKAVRMGTFMVGREAPHHKCPKQTGDSHKTFQDLRRLR